jgi:hypothetical protein
MFTEIFKELKASSINEYCQKDRIDSHIYQPSTVFVYQNESADTFTYGVSTLEQRRKNSPKNLEAKSKFGTPEQWHEPSSILKMNNYYAISYKI